MKNIGKKITAIALTSAISLGLGLINSGTAQATAYPCPPGLELVEDSIQKVRIVDRYTRVTYTCSNEDGSITAVGTVYE